MVLKRFVPALVPALICVGSLALASAALADEYRADEYLGLDLSRAVLSPRPLGPPQQFAPVAVEAKGDRSDRGSEASWARNDLKTEPRKVVVQDVKVTAPLRVTHPHRATPHSGCGARIPAGDSRTQARRSPLARIQA